MPSKSKAQQRFFGVVKGIQKGSTKGSGKAKKAARDMSPTDVDDFASTKHKGLPNRVKQETKVRQLIRNLVREIMKEAKNTQLKMPYRDRKKVTAILKKLRAKEGRDFDFGVGKGTTFVLDIDKKFENKFLDLAIKNRIQVREGFAGALTKEQRKKFDDMRRKQAEVLGYTLTGKNDMKVEIDDATIMEGKETYVVWSPLLNKVYDGPVSEKQALRLIKKYAKQGQYHVGMLGTEYFNRTKLGKKNPIKVESKSGSIKLVKALKKAVKGGLKLEYVLTEDVVKDMMKQIGRNTLRYIGAKNFAKGKQRGMQYIQFDVKGSKMKRGGRILVYYNRGKDLYNVEGWIIRNLKAKKVATKKDIYADRLADTIESITG